MKKSLKKKNERHLAGHKPIPNKNKCNGEPLIELEPIAFL